MFTAVLFTVPRYGSPLNVLNRGIIKEDVATAAFKHHKIDHTHTHTHTHTRARAHTHLLDSDDHAVNGYVVPTIILNEGKKIKQTKE